jgi:heterodisulfide reductase subunit A2
MTQQNDKKVGAVLVLGGGIAGMQASLDLANSGLKVYLVDRSPTIGGTMAQLDKTFPTNDCSMCIVSPKLVEVARHIDIETITNSELDSLTGEAGNFKAVLKSYPRYIDVEKCTGCGVCRQSCPVRAVNEFNYGLDRRAATYIRYPQAVPLAYAIDRDVCIGCGLCEKVCLAKAVKYADETKEREVAVGAVVLAPGFQLFDPRRMAGYEYAESPNIVSSMEFERILSATGPFQGHIMRPFDRDEPTKIAWLQCVGSRDEKTNPYCSSVCCMYAIKQAVIAKEHCKEYNLETSIFFMDMRTHGKDFEKYYWRAEQESGVRFIRSRVHSIDPDPETGNIHIRYMSEDGTVQVEEFHMVVLSCGLEISSEVMQLAEKLGVDITPETHFAWSSPFAPVTTNRAGVFVCGAFQVPGNIPQSGGEASATPASAGELLGAARGTELQVKELPPEEDVEGQEPRVGVFVCNCGINIGGVINVPKLTEYVATLPGVAVADQNLFTCSTDTQGKILNFIKEQKLNRVVVASCSPRTHMPMFQETVREAGLNPYLFEMANIRDQDSWVHMHEPEKALEKAKDLIRGAVARVVQLEPLHKQAFPVTKAALVIGGGVAGMEAALSVADMGFQAYLVEKGDKLGGQAWNLVTSARGYDYRGYLEDLIKRVENHANIEILFNTTVTDTGGFIGNFASSLKTPEGERQVEHGVTIMATGGFGLKPEEYLYGQNPKVRTSLEMDELIAAKDPKIKEAKEAVFIQCVGSREPERPYCSRLCCTHSVENAIELKELNPDLDVFILYRDLRTYGDRELLYKKARELGVMFIRFDVDSKPQVQQDTEGNLTVTINDPILGRPVMLKPDLLTLASAILPNPVEDIGEIFKVPRNAEGFLNEAHAKLRPVDLPSDGLFLAGLAHYPKPIDESIAQAKAAAGRAATFLAKNVVEVGGIIAVVDPDKCAVCLTCVRACPFNVPVIDYTIDAAYIDPAKCQGCGVCPSECPAKAITLKNFTDSQIIAQEEALAAG